VSNLLHSTYDSLVEELLSLLFVS